MLLLGFAKPTAINYMGKYPTMKTTFERRIFIFYVTFVDVLLYTENTACVPWESFLLCFYKALLHVQSHCS